MRSPEQLRAEVRRLHRQLAFTTAGSPEKAPLAAGNARPSAQFYPRGASSACSASVSYSSARSSS